MLARHPAAVGVLLASVLAWLAVGATSVARAQGGEAWAHLGPPGPRAVVAIAPAADWPREPVLLAARADSEVGQPAEYDLVRTFDGGATWERLSAPAEQIFLLRLAPPLGAERPAFAAAGSAGYDGVKRLFRSPDGGTSWQEVLARSARDLSLTISPDFAVDRLAFVVGGGEAFRSRDGGRSWEAVDPVPDQRVQQIALSPAFADDRTAFLVVTSADLGDKPTGQPDHELSAGLLVSTDGGETWTPTGGPEVDGIPYRQVGQVVVSPTYDQDGSLLAFGWGPWGTTPMMGANVPVPTAATFLSRDGGATWTKVFEGGWRHTVALSPTFAADGVALLARFSRGLSPASYTCTVLRTSDWGATWATVRQPGSYEGCGRQLLLASGGQVVGLSQKGGDGGGGWARSTDGGRTWSGLTGGPAAQRSLVPSPAFEQDGTIFVGGGFGGLLALGPSLQSTDGRLPCAAPLAGGFGRVWESESWVREHLGCPLEAERPVRLRERQFEERGFAIRAYWPDDESPDWHRLSRSTSSTYQGWQRQSKAQDPWPDVPERAFDGVLQPFEGGLMLWVPYPDGRRAILVLARPEGTWRELAD